MIDIQKLKKKIIGMGFSEFTNLFLFGISGKDVMKFARAVRRLPDHEELTETEQTVRGEPDYACIRKRISQWMASGNHLIADFSISDLSESIDIPKKDLFRYFERHLRQDFRSWKSDLRIEKAKSLLLEDTGNQNLRSLANSVGFRDKSNFHRQFKQRTGCTPAEWRQTGGHPELVGQD